MFQPTLGQRDLADGSEKLDVWSSLQPEVGQRDLADGSEKLGV